MVSHLDGKDIKQKDSKRRKDYQGKINSYGIDATESRPKSSKNEADITKKA